MFVVRRPGGFVDAGASLNGDGGDVAMSSAVRQRFCTTRLTIFLIKNKKRIQRYRWGRATYHRHSRKLQHRRSQIETKSKNHPAPPPDHPVPRDTRPALP
jgi:hypothetical protein